MMEHSQKNTDCYFFYYSTCLKGDACAFRHEPSALGCETMCSYWQSGNCLNEHCNFRHMELKKNRKSIACYWETQPGGCRKPHCCFMHKNARGPTTAEPINPGRNNELTAKPVNQEWSNRQDDGKYDSDPRTTLDGSSTESDQGRGGSEAGSFIGSPAVDPLVVNFEEESDNESVPSPTKPQLRMLHVKTLEEIKLERIQAESAAYYNYTTEDTAGGHNVLTLEVGDGGGGGGGGGGGSSILERNLRSRLANRLTARSSSLRTNLDFQVLSLDEIRKRRRRMAPSTPTDLPSRTKVPRLVDDVSSSVESRTTGKTDEQNCCSDSEMEKSDPANRGPRAALTATAPPVRLRRPNRTMPLETSSSRRKISRYNSGEILQEQPEMTSSDSSQDAAVVPDRLTLVASRPSLSARNDRDQIKMEEVEAEEEEEEKDAAATRLQDQNGLSATEEGLFNGNSAPRNSISRSISEDDYLMMDVTSSTVDQSASAPGAEDILQDIDELLND
ncbi:zinc finger CCCH domain-containing protein 11B-like isoform X2 [Diprion similis]|uniref:zinc finger CCCH domain-containing protein 11B-like isoform X2 n=1 Tax=Diprion similis TaxID=362088 RepID=UPI001EF842F8|nr:zinc finger CCCH domain-containing protein 11B-like isoform X2 [Diprion similis]